MKPILNAICQLIQWQKKCTIAQIAKISGLKQATVLDVLVNNQLLLRQDKKTGNIVGFNHTVVYRNPDEKWYYLEDINYGCDKAIKLSHQNFPELIQAYYCGGLGDSYRIDIILSNDKNLNIIQKAGFIPYADRKQIPIEERWKE